MDYLTGVSEPFAVTKEKYHLDYLIGGVHLIVDKVPELVEGPALSEKIWFTVDAHHFSEITLEFAAAEEALKRAGYRSVVNFKDGHWVEVAIS